jgi:plastocyanin domain-containing protein
MKAKKSVTHKRVASSVQASMEFEGLKPSTYAKRIGENYLEGKISSEDAREKIRAKHASSFGK